MVANTYALIPPCVVSSLLQISLNSETIGIFYEFIGDGFKVKSENRIFKKILKNDKYFKNIQLG